jgi:NAD+ synthetase
MPVLDLRGLAGNRIEALRSYHRRTRIPLAELDVSGGVDSALVLGLLARALGPGRVTAVHSSIDSAPQAADRAREVADTFDVPLVVLDISEPFHRIVDALVAAMAEAGYDLAAMEDRCEADPTIHGSFRSCLRAPVGRFANRLAGGGLRHGTGNECEDRWLRFYQKGGDGEVDTNPVAMLSKGEVYQLALAIGVPQAIVTARPTPDLWGDGEQHNDEDEIAAWLGLTEVTARGLAFYSYVDVQTGEYSNVGLIERVARFVDDRSGAGAPLFSPELPEGALDAMAAAACASTFAGIDPALTADVLRAARHAECITRHKANPAIPTLGGRADLLASGLLTDELPL